MGVSKVPFMSAIILFLGFSACDPLLFLQILPPNPVPRRVKNSEYGYASNMFRGAGKSNQCLHSKKKILGGKKLDDLSEGIRGWGLAQLVTSLLYKQGFDLWYAWVREEDERSGRKLSSVSFIFIYL